MNIPEGIIDLDSDFAKEIGFTSDKFDGYLWGWSKENKITISFIESLHPRKGNFRKLFENIEKITDKIHVPCPSEKMRQIIEKNGYIFIGGEHEIWEKEIR